MLLKLLNKIGTSKITLVLLGFALGNQVVMAAEPPNKTVGKGTREFISVAELTGDGCEAALHQTMRQLPELARGTLRRAQEALMAPILEQIVGTPHTDIAAISRPFDPKHPNGDYHAIYQTEPNQVNIVWADVAGHGYKAGPWSLRLHILLQKNKERVMEILRDEDPSALLEFIDKQYRLTDVEKRYWPDEHDMPFLAISHVKMDLITGRVQYANAGQPPLKIRKKNGTVMEVSSGNMPLGIMPFVKSGNVSDVLLQAGDTLYMVSDGMTEVMTPDTRKSDSVADLPPQLRAINSLIGRTSPKTILQRVIAFVMDEYDLLPAHIRSKELIPRVLSKLEGKTDLTAVDYESAVRREIDRQTPMRLSDAIRRVGDPARVGAGVAVKSVVRNMKPKGDDYTIIAATFEP